MLSVFVCAAERQWMRATLAEYNRNWRLVCERGESGEQRGGGEQGELGRPGRTPSASQETSTARRIARMRSKLMARQLQAVLWNKEAITGQQQEKEKRKEKKKSTTADRVPPAAVKEGGLQPPAATNEGAAEAVPRDHFDR